MVLEEEEEIEEVEAPTPIKEVVKPPGLLPLQAHNESLGLLPAVPVGARLRYFQTF